MTLSRRYNNLISVKFRNIIMQISTQHPLQQIPHTRYSRVRVTVTRSWGRSYGEKADFENVKLQVIF